MNNLDDINNGQMIAICRGAAQRCEEQHGYMALASSDPHNWLPHRWVIDAMYDLLSINSKAVFDLRAENADLRKINFELRGAAKCENLHHCKSEQHCFSEPCKVLERIDSKLYDNRSPENH